MAYRYKNVLEDSRRKRGRRRRSQEKAMDLSSEVQEALRVAVTESKLNDESFHKLISYVAIRLLRLEDAPDTAKDDAAFNSAYMKLACFGLATLFAEAAKNNANSTVIRTVLEGIDASPTRASDIINKYEVIKQKLQAELSSIGHYPPHIVDVDWKQDYLIKNNQLDKISKLNYTIAFKTEKSGCPDVQTLQFSCTLEELQDLVAKLKDASKAVERISQAM